MVAEGQGHEASDEPVFEEKAVFRWPHETCTSAVQAFHGSAAAICFAAIHNASSANKGYPPKVRRSIELPAFSKPDIESLRRVAIHSSGECSGFRTS